MQSANYIVCDKLTGAALYKVTTAKDKVKVASHQIAIESDSNPDEV